MSLFCAVVLISGLFLGAPGAHAAHDACVAHEVVDQPALVETPLWAPIVATPTRLYRLAFNVETFDRRGAGTWGGAHLVGLTRPPGYKGGMSLGAVVVHRAEAEAETAATTVWMAHWATKDIQELLLPADATDNITVTTRVGGGSTVPTPDAPRPGADVALWHLGSLAYHNGTAYTVTETGGPATGAMVVARTDAPFNTWAFPMPCQARAVAANSPHRVFVVCYESNARIVRVDLDAATGLPTGTSTVLGRVGAGTTAPHAATIIGPEARPTLYTSGYLQYLTAVTMSADFSSCTATAAVAHDGALVPASLALHGIDNDVVVGRSELPAMVLRCAETLDDGTCERRELATEKEIRGGTEYRQVLLRNNTAYEFSDHIRILRRNAPGQALSFHQQFAPAGFDTAVGMAATGFYMFTQGAVWLPGATKLTAWVGGSTALRIFEVAFDEDDSVEPTAVSVAGGGATALTVGGAAVAGAAAQLSYVGQLAVGGDFVFFGPALPSHLSPSAFTRVRVDGPQHEVEVFPHPCIFRAIAAHAEVVYAVCWDDARVVAIATTAWRPTGLWSVLHTLSSWGWTPNIALTEDGSVLWVTAWGGPVAKIVLGNSTDPVMSESRPAIGAHTPRALSMAGRDVWLTSHNNPFELRCILAEPTAAPTTPAPTTAALETPAPTPVPPQETSAPDTPAPVPETPTPATSAPETPAPPTPVPETFLPTSQPETSAPGPTTPPETPVPETAVPPTPVPETPLPETPVPTTPEPSTAVPQRSPPETSLPTPVPETAQPSDGTQVPTTPVPETFLPTSQPDTSAPGPTTPLETSVPETLVPTTTATPETPAPRPPAPTAVPPTPAPTSPAPAPTTPAPITTVPSSTTGAPGAPTPRPDGPGTCNTCACDTSARNARTCDAGAQKANSAYDADS